MNDDLPIDDPLAPLPDDELGDDDEVVIDPKKVPILDPEEDHESIEALADEEEEEIDADLDEGDSF
ncbi:hypothetical protein KW796_02400 [Candidatus Parcubacteria bacterium]|nr:hypothetical protein [Candidatus Parcubacteria bacterium]